MSILHDHLLIKIVLSDFKIKVLERKVVWQMWILIFICSLANLPNLGNGYELTFTFVQWFSTHSTHEKWPKKGIFILRILSINENSQEKMLMIKSKDKNQILSIFSKNKSFPMIDKRCTIFTNDTSNKIS